jgi:CheY-like chemotaxis protein
MKKFDTIYVVDDDETYQFIVKRIVVENCAVNTIRGFLNGRDAIEELQMAVKDSKMIPELILLDLTMPVMDGWQFLEKYILLQPRIGKKITIYITSSSVNPKDVERARDIEQVSDYIVKPITREKFTDMIGRMAA